MSAGHAPCDVVGSSSKDPSGSSREAKKPKRKWKVSVPSEFNSGLLEQPTQSWTQSGSPGGGSSQKAKKQEGETRLCQSESDLRRQLEVWSPRDGMDVVDAVHGHSDSFTIREFMQCLAVVVNSRHSMDGMPLLPETQLAEDIIRQCKEKGISLGTRQAYFACATGQGGTIAMRHRLALGVLSIMELCALPHSKAPPDAIGSMVVFETAAIFLYYDADGTVVEAPVHGSMMGQMPKFTDATPFPSRSGTYEKQNPDTGLGDAPLISVGKLDIGLAKAADVLLVGPAAVLATNEFARQKFDLRRWHSTDVSSADKVLHAIAAAWDLLMFLLPIYTPHNLQVKLFGTTALSGLHADKWVRDQFAQVGWSKSLGNFVYHDALSYVIVLEEAVRRLSSSTSKKITKVDTAELEDFMLASAQKWLKRNLAPHLCHKPNGELRSLEERISVGEREGGMFIMKETWSQAMSRAKLCALAMMGSFTPLREDERLSLPVLVVDGGGTRWQLLALEECCRQSTCTLRSRAVFPLAPGLVEEEAADGYAREVATTFNPFRRRPWRLVVIQLTHTQIGFSAGNRGQLNGAILVATMHVGEGYAPLVLLLSSWIKGKGGGGGKWIGNWSGRVSDSGLYNIFAALAALFASNSEWQSQEPWCDPRHYTLLRDWYDAQDQAVQSKVWEHSTARLVKHMPELESVQVGGDDGMLDLSDAHAMDWVVQ